MRGPEVVEYRPGHPSATADRAGGPPWPFGLRALFALCCLAVPVGAAQIASVRTLARGWTGDSWLQGAYWAAAWLLAVAAVVTGALRHRRAFGVICLAGAILHILVTSYFNLTIVSPTGPPGQSNVLRRWDGDTLIYFWNWAAIGIHAGVCYYLLRYEWPRWKSCAAPAQRGFPVAETSETRNR